MWSNLQEAVCSTPAPGVHPRSQRSRRCIGRIPEPTAAAEAAPRTPRRHAALNGRRVALWA